MSNQEVLVHTMSSLLIGLYGYPRMGSSTALLEYISSFYRWCMACG